MENTDFRAYLEEAIGRENAAVAFSAFDRPASVSLRRNPFKSVPEFPWQGREVAWNSHAVILDGRPMFTLDPLFHAGAYYVQDSSSMFVGHMFRAAVASHFAGIDRPLRVLDLCAAPGGKTTDIAASLREICGDRFLLVANEVMKQRAAVLADNAALWGDPNVAVTSADPGAFAALRGFFDIIVADVPCSGEGMFRKDAEAVAQWSADNVALCVARQRRIVGDVWDALADDGIFIYSTCTFNRYENDGNAEWIAGTLGAEILSGESRWEWMESAGNLPGVLRTESGFSLVPGFVEGEGQYCAVMRKNARGDVYRPVKMRKDRPPVFPGKPEALLDRDVTLLQKNGLVIAVPSVISSVTESLSAVVRPLSCGCAVGVYKGRDLVPDADLALSYMLADGAFPVAGLTKEDALRYLHRDAIVPDGCGKGYVAVSYMGLPLGFVKNIGSRCNSLHPLSRRIRMSIEI